MATKRDYYEVLGIDRQASTEELKKAYRTLAVLTTSTHDNKRSEDVRTRISLLSEMMSWVCCSLTRTWYGHYQYSHNTTPNTTLVALCSYQREAILLDRRYTTCT
jgi:curved DNA-binding protein CbpA